MRYFVIVLLFLFAGEVFAQSIEQQKVLDLADDDLKLYVLIAIDKTLNYHCSPKKVFIKGLDSDGTMHIAVRCLNGKELAIYIYGNYSGTIQATTCRLYRVLEGQDCWSHKMKS